MKTAYILVLLMGLMARAIAVDPSEKEAFDDDAENEVNQDFEEDFEDEEERTSPVQPLRCLGGFKTLQIIGGKSVVQKYDSIVINGKCTTVLPGGTAASYTMKNCSSCKASGGSFMCSGASLARSGNPKCEMVTGIDCRKHEVLASDHTKACA